MISKARSYLFYIPKWHTGLKVKFSFLYVNGFYYVFVLPSWNFDSPTLICKPWTSSTEWQSYTTHACKDMAVAVATLASQVFLKFFKRWWGFFLIKKLDYLTKIQGLLFQGVCSNWYTIFFYLLSLNTFFYSIDERWVIQTQLNKVVRCIDLSYLN